MLMNQSSLTEIIKDQTKRALWEVKNIIACVPNELWNKRYCGMPLWKHIYHMLHSLDLWFVNPRDPLFVEPLIHEEGLNNLDAASTKQLFRIDINQYLEEIENKIISYVNDLSDTELLNYPESCEYTKFTLILAQFRHLHSHMGMIMGFIIDDVDKWPKVLGLEKPFPQGKYAKYF